jgi:hypothetical protein
VWGLASFAQPAHAAELRIDSTAPAECFSVRALKARVMALMGSAPDADVFATVEVTRSAEGYRAQVTVRGPSGLGSRRLEDPRCDVLVDSVAVMIALSIPSPDSPKPALVLRPEGRIAYGMLPRTAAGAGASVALEGLGRFRFELHGAYYVPQSTTFDLTTLGGRFQLFTAGACICHLWSFANVQWGPCVGAEVHSIRASGFGGEIRRSGSTAWWGPSARLFARLQLWPAFGISLAVEGVVPMTRPQFIFSDVEQLHRVGAIALQASVGPEIRF